MFSRYPNNYNCNNLVTFASQTLIGQLKGTSLTDLKPCFLQHVHTQPQTSKTDSTSYKRSQSSRYSSHLSTTWWEQVQIDKPHGCCGRPGGKEKVGEGRRGWTAEESTVPDHDRPFRGWRERRRSVVQRYGRGEGLSSMSTTGARGRGVKSSPTCCQSYGLLLPWTQLHKHLHPTSV